MRFSFFNFFRDEKYNLIIIALDIRNIPGAYDLFDRILFIILADILILLLLFVCEYVFYRISTKYLFIRNKLCFFKKNKKVYYFNKDRPAIKKRDEESLLYIRYKFNGRGFNKRIQRYYCYYTRT